MPPMTAYRPDRIEALILNTSLSKAIYLFLHLAFNTLHQPLICSPTRAYFTASLPSPLPLPLVVSCFCLPWPVVMLSPVNLQLCNHHPLPLTPMVGYSIFRPLHSLSSLLRGLFSCCAVASRSAFLAPLVRMVVTSPLQMPPHPICWCLCLSSCRCLLLHHGLPYLLSSWLLHCLYSRRCLPSAGVSASHCAIASCHAMASIPLVWLVVPSPLSLILLACPSGWLLCFLCRSSSWHAPASWRAPASWHTTSTSHLPLAFLLPPMICRHLRLSSCCCLSLHYGLTYLLTGWLLYCLYCHCCLPSSGVTADCHAVASRCAMASRTSCLADCCVTSASHPLGAPLQLVVASPLPLIDAPSSHCAPASQHATSTSHPSWCTTSTSHLLFAFCLPWMVVALLPCCAAFATHPLDMQLPLKTPADCSVASCCTTFAIHVLNSLSAMDSHDHPLKN